MQLCSGVVILSHKSSFLFGSAKLRVALQMMSDPYEAELQRIPDGWLVCMVSCLLCPVMRAVWSYVLSNHMLSSMPWW
jgi:hypothetical protein